MDINTLLRYGSRLIILMMCIPIHEFAHAWAATKLGDDTPGYQNRLTLNPLAHLDPIGSIGILLCGFGWGKPVQVNPARFNRKISMRAGMAITAAAGPLSNLIMALMGTICFKFLLGSIIYKGTSDVSMYKYVIQNLEYADSFAYAFAGDKYMALYWLLIICEAFVFINIGLAVFNLIPVSPLDGQKIFAYFLPDRINAKIANYQLYISVIVLGLLTFSDLFNGPVAWMESGIFWVLNKITFFIDPIVNMVFK
jgi:Zn-dependent protease